jgi:hypothetical protein
VENQPTASHDAMARALALDAGEFFDGLAEDSAKLGPKKMMSAARYARQLAEQFRTMADEIMAARKAEREVRRAQRWHKLPDGTLAEAQGKADANRYQFIRRRTGPSNGVHVTMMGPALRERTVMGVLCFGDRAAPG